MKTMFQILGLGSVSMMALSLVSCQCGAARDCSDCPCPSSYQCNNEYYQTERPNYHAQGCPQNPSSNYREANSYQNQRSYQNGNQGQRYTNNPSDRGNNSVSDQEIANSVRDALASGWFSKGFQNVTFDVINGTVTLRGYVDSLDNKTKVEENIKKIDGVKQVNNQILIDKVAASSSPKFYTEPELINNERRFPQDKANNNDDRQLNANIREKLDTGWFSKGFEATALNTNNGAVTVSGVVNSREDAQEANDQIRGIQGVKSVNNQLRVRNR